jgi:endonuclease YncB( thermonuclease family)
VETCWIDAKGSSRRQQFFGKITLADGSDLGLPLVEAGLARSYGMRQGLKNS